MSNADEEPHRQPKEYFAKAVLTNYGQLLANSAAYGTSIHRIKLAKFQELSNIPPNFEDYQSSQK